MTSSTWAHQTIFFHPGVAHLLDHWLLTISYWLLTLAMAFDDQLLAIGYYLWLLATDHWLLAIEN